VSISDYVQPTYLGSGARVYRASTTTISPVTTSGASQLLPTTFFDNTDKSTADITVDLTNGKFTVSNAGWYKATVRVANNGTNGFQPSGAGGSLSISPLLYKNGSINQWGNPAFAYFTQTDGAVGGVNALWLTFDVYLAANDYVQFGYNNSAGASSTPKFVGESTGAKTYFSIELMNRSIA
jgi:hypothetical protein